MGRVDLDSMFGDLWGWCVRAIVRGLEITGCVLAILLLSVIIIILSVIDWVFT